LSRENLPFYARRLNSQKQIPSDLAWVSLASAKRSSAAGIGRPEVADHRPATGAGVPEIAVRARSFAVGACSNPVRASLNTVGAHSFGVRVQEFAVRACSYGVRASSFSVRVRSYSVGACSFCVGACFFYVRAPEFWKRVQECGHSREGFELGKQSNLLIYKDFRESGQKEPLLRVGLTGHQPKLGLAQPRPTSRTTVILSRLSLSQNCFKNRTSFS
jgi:hypothetical protein